MSDDPLLQISADPGDPMYEAFFAMMEAMREALVPHLSSFADPRDGLTVAMSAAATFAGTHCGTLMATGAFKRQDRRRCGEAALANFRQGIDFGLARGLRVGAEQHGGHA